MSKIQNILIPIISSAIFIASCGGGNTESLTDLKSQQAELKTQLAEINAKISKLEGDSSKKFALVEASIITPAIFKTYINVQGRVDAEESVSLSSEMPGTITKINVKPGDQVSQGQVLAETDARALQQTISDLQTNYELVNLLYEKQKALWDQKIGTEVQYLQSKTQKESIEKKMLTLQEQVRMTKVHKGDEVLIKFPDSNDTLTARINYSSRSINAMNRTFGVEIVLNNNKEFHPNQIAVLSINDYKSQKPVLSIPLNYIQKDLKGAPFVLVADGTKAAKRNVTLGKEYNGVVEILAGLLESDLVIKSGYDGLNEGDAIKLK
jgi:membrane fusion protein (multidrug efflux system)